MKSINNLGSNRKNCAIYHINNKSNSNRDKKKKKILKIKNLIIGVKKYSAPS